jgi:uncharacterized protein (DUF2252 family)
MISFRMDGIDRLLFSWISARGSDGLYLIGKANRTGFGIKRNTFRGRRIRSGEPFKKTENKAVVLLSG